MRTIIECVPNISEGSDRAAIDAIAAAVRGVTGVRLLDVSSDASHNRSVLTFVGDAPAVRAGVLALFEAALSAHRPARRTAASIRAWAPSTSFRSSRSGAARSSDCVALSREVGAEIARRFGVPVLPVRGVRIVREAAQPRGRAQGPVRGLRREDEGPALEPGLRPDEPHAVGRRRRHGGTGLPDRLQHQSRHARPRHRGPHRQGDPPPLRRASVTSRRWASSWPTAASSRSRST